MQIIATKDLQLNSVLIETSARKD